MRAGFVICSTACVVVHLACVCCGLGLPRRDNRKDKRATTKMREREQEKEQCCSKRASLQVCAVVSSTRNAGGKGKQDVEIVQDANERCRFRHSVAHCTDTQICGTGQSNSKTRKKIKSVKRKIIRTIARDKTVTKGTMGRRMWRNGSAAQRLFLETSCFILGDLPGDSRAIQRDKG